MEADLFVLQCFICFVRLTIKIDGGIIKPFNKGTANAV